MSDEQSQSYSGPVGAERRRAVELGPLVGNGSASAHAAERGHQPGSGDKAQPRFGHRSEHGGRHHPAPG